MPTSASLSRLSYRTQPTPAELHAAWRRTPGALRWETLQFPGTSPSSSSSVGTVTGNRATTVWSSKRRRLQIPYGDTGDDRATQQRQAADEQPTPNRGTAALWGCRRTASRHAQSVLDFDTHAARILHALSLFFS